MSTAVAPCPASFPTPIVYKGVPVMTTSALASAYGVDPLRIRQNLHANKARFVEGKHFFSVEGQDLAGLRVVLNDSQISPRTRKANLWTARGAARHAKSLESDAAWNVYEQLEDAYFGPSAPAQPVAIAPTLATKAERKPLVDLVRMWVSMAPIGYGPAFRQVNTAMGVSSVEDMTVETVQRAIAWVQERIDAIQAAPVALPAPPAPAPCPALPAIPDDLRARLKAHAHACIDFQGEVCSRARQLMMEGSRLSYEVGTHLNPLFLHTPSGYLNKTRVYDAMTTFSSNGIRSIEAGTDNLYLTARLMEGLAGMR